MSPQDNQEKKKKLGIKICLILFAALIVSWLLTALVFLPAKKTEKTALETEDTALNQEFFPETGKIGKERFDFSEPEIREPVKPEKIVKKDEYPEVIGWSFVNASIKPLHYELHKRFWGWRPNDIIRITDNVNNFQLGVLEVTRRTSVKLAEDISRTGSNAAFDPNLEQAMNWFMIRPGKYWFPSAESKYKAGLKELERYQTKLIRRQASFYNRSDNLIPLLIAYKNLLGSCDENLTKTHESNGKKLSFFKADDYFYYAKGVASAMTEILEAIEHDFKPLLQSRNGLDVLGHAIESCRSAKKLNPIIVLNSGYNSLLANHRANLASHISNARFYIDVLITTIST